MTECLHMLLDGAQRGRVPVSCRNPQCEDCGWNPECSARRREVLREREEREELVDRELMERSLAAFEADVDACRSTVTPLGTRSGAEGRCTDEDAKRTAT